MKIADDTLGSATLSDDGIYRYQLRRTWIAPTGPVAIYGNEVVWIMLNPSTADGFEDDSTILRCSNFARRWGYGGIRVVNLFAARAKFPRLLRQHPAPIGRDNDDWIVAAVEAPSTKLVVAAWGRQGTYLDRDREVRNLLRQKGIDLYRLDVPLNANGTPQHPLYKPISTGAIPWT